MLRAAGALVLVVAASSFGAPAVRGDELQTISRDFWRWRAANQPVTGDDIPRLDRPADWTPDWTRAAVNRRRAEVAAFESRLEKIDASGLPVAWQVDRRLLRSAFARVRWELDVERGWERNAMFYVDQTMGALLDALLEPPPFSRARAAQISRRLAGIPATVESAKGNLRLAQGPFARLAIASLEGIRERLASSLRELKPLLPAGTGADLDPAAARAIAALENYREWLGNRLPALREQTSVGREAYLFFLRNVALLPFTPEELLAMGRQEWARSVARETYEEARNAGLPAPALEPDQAAQMASLDRAEARTRQFLEDKNLLTVPASVRRYRELSLPGYLSPLASLGELDDLTSETRRGQPAVRYIPRPEPSLGFFALSMARDPRPILVHEGLPGHAFQLAMSWAHEDPVRRGYYDSSANEGIAFYAEEMMLDAGFFDDSPRTRETIASFLRLRALRVEVDVRLALGDFSIEQAAEYLARTVPMDPETARAEAAEFASTPGQAISYEIGKLQILRFLADARRVQGKKFSLRAFHDFLWKNGNVPIALQRWELLGLRDDLDLLDKPADRKR
ncbi:MAG: DUF885 family protein [Acidobacteriota bacterium]